ncbi:hypothetical protein B0H13DRAFT_1880397 [Mycena leptocephala]|nr:hypothetical protein B0H13DRAFT_1880397 [Mycena leptocephala]
MSYNPESTVARPLLALTTSSSASAAYAPGAANAARASSSSPPATPSSSAGLPIPDRLAPYYTPPMFPGAHGGNAPPPAHGSGHEEHPHPGAPPEGRPPPIDGPDAAPPSSHSSDPNSDSPDDTAAADASAHITAFLSSQPATLPAARACYTLKASAYPRGGARVSGGRHEKEGVGKRGGGWRGREDGAGLGRGGGGGEEDTHGIAALAIRDGCAHKPEHQAIHFDGDWEGTVNKFASALPPMTVLINGRDEPRVVFGVGPLFEDPPALTPALTLSDPTPFALSSPRTGTFFAQPGRKNICRPPRARMGWHGSGPAHFVAVWIALLRRYFSNPSLGVERRVHDRPRPRVYSMTKLADASTSVSGGDNSVGGGSCFADALVSVEPCPCCAAVLVARLLASLFGSAAG